MVREKGKAGGRREELKGVRAKGGKEEGLAITPKRNYSYVAFFFLFFFRQRIFRRRTKELTLNLFGSFIAMQRRLVPVQRMKKREKDEKRKKLNSNNEQKRNRQKIKNSNNEQKNEKKKAKKK